MSDEPVVLGFDTSSKYCSVALFSGCSLIAEIHQPCEREQAELLFPQLEQLLASSETSWSGINLIGVGTGPGNFAGIRLAVSAARGLSMSLQVPAIGVNRFDALSFGSQGHELVMFPASARRLFCRMGMDGIPYIADAEQVTVPAGTDCIATEQTRCKFLAKCARSIRGPKLKPGAAVAAVAHSRSDSPQPMPVPMYLRPAINANQHLQD